MQKQWHSAAPQPCWCRQNLPHYATPECSKYPLMISLESEGAMSCSRISLFRHRALQSLWIEKILWDPGHTYLIAPSEAVTFAMKPVDLFAGWWSCCSQVLPESTLGQQLLSTSGGQQKQMRPLSIKVEKSHQHSNPYIERLWTRQAINSLFVEKY